MRLWHIDLIPVLPRKQLIAQWRECCCIARNIAKNGTPNHLLVNKVLNYEYSDFIYYTTTVISEMEFRGYNIDKKSKEKFFENVMTGRCYFKVMDDKPGIFTGWHNKRYLVQCFHNLEEKYDCGMFTFDEWMKVCNYIRK